MFTQNKFFDKRDLVAKHVLIFMLKIVYFV